jgi:hypothetical protein
MNNRYLFSIILVVFIDLLGFSLIIARPGDLLLERVSYWAPGAFGALLLFITFAYVLKTAENVGDTVAS